MKPKVVPIANPSSIDGQERLARFTSEEPVTDRAYRYRAVQVMEQLPAASRERCHFCGNDNAPLLAGHVDGHEENCHPANISPTCRSCNNAIAAKFAQIGVGRRTRQFNPAAPATRREEYTWAIYQLRFSRSKATIQRAIARIQSTPHADRNRFVS